MSGYNVKNVAVTAGYITPEARKEFYKYMDAANVDLKGFTEEFYHKLCNGHLSDVLETLSYLKNETDVWLEITNLIIPGQNDQENDIDSMTKWINTKLGSNVALFFYLINTFFLY